MTERVKICCECHAENGVARVVCSDCGAVLVDPPVVICGEQRGDTANPPTHGDDARPADVLVGGESCLEKVAEADATSLERVAAERIDLRHLGSGAVFGIGPGQVLGRLVDGDPQRPDVDVGCIEDRDTISRRHVQFVKRTHRWFARNLSRTNFITVNGLVIDSPGEEVPIRQGTALGLSNVVFMVECEDDVPR